MPTPEQELARAKEEYEKAKAQAKARYDQAKARHNADARKLDTRRKVIAGGALFELASRDVEAAIVLDRILDGIPREVDRKAFDGWDRMSGKGNDDGNATKKTEPLSKEPTDVDPRTTSPDSKFDLDPREAFARAEAIMAEQTRLRS